MRAWRPEMTICPGHLGDPAFPLRGGRGFVTRFAAIFVCGAALVASAYAQPAAAPTQRYTAARSTEFVHPGTPGLILPTAVAVAQDGTVFVADGVHDRLVEFGPDGQWRQDIETVGDARLTRPLGLRIDAQDQLWISDTGAQRVLVRAPDGSLADTFTFAGAELAAPPDITDAYPSPDGRFLWIADNDHSQLLRVDRAARTTTVVGTLGAALGQLNYPYSLAVNVRGDVVVSDVINGRVQVFNAEGAAAGTIATYGVELGQLYRPKGLALDRDSNVWVTDSTLGVVQVFTRDGRLIDVLRDAAGQPLHFEHPIGLAFDVVGAIYVVEQSAPRVIKLTLNVDAAAAPAQLPSRRSAAGVGPQAQSCTMCHLEWMRPLADGQATALIGVPPNPASQPNVSRAETCLSCHDGGVADSRKRVWVQHGHKTGIAPPPSITVPPELPLADGKLACRTCHTAHGPSSAGNTFQKIVFLRVQGHASELCVKCHSAYAGGVEHGMHPLPKEISFEFPQRLVHPGARADGKSITCLSCHTGHGSDFNRLQVLNPQTNDLCLSCHERVKPDLFDDAHRSRHGKMPKLNAEQQAVAEELQTKTGAGGELLCTTCHKQHHAESPRNLLAFELTQQDVCARCHMAQKDIAGSAHDLRTNFPDEQNILGVPARESGTCGACHGAHRPTRQPFATEADPAGLCTSCHRPDAVAAQKPVAPMNHPGGCTGCHNPHQPQGGRFLKAAQPVTLCQSCHQNYQVQGGPHDVTSGNPAWPAASVATGDACLACHRPHGGADTGLYRVGAVTDPVPADGACLACHEAAQPGSTQPHALMHPRHVPETKVTGVDLPFACDTSGQIGIECKTCHNPHAASADNNRLLRVNAGQTAFDLCTECHTEQQNIRQIGHAAVYLQAAGYQTEACLPCHVTHGSAADVNAKHLWPRDLTLAHAPEGAHLVDSACFACHQTGGGAPVPGIATHPEVTMFNPTAPGTPGYLPLFNRQGVPDPQGFIACETCHLTHGRDTPAPLPPGIAALSPRELRARAYHVREFGAGNVCTTCHGLDAIRRFMYFHDAQRRKGPIQTPAPAGGL